MGVVHAGIKGGMLSKGQGVGNTGQAILSPLCFQFRLPLHWMDQYGSIYPKVGVRGGGGALVPAYTGARCVQGGHIKLI